MAEEVRPIRPEKCAHTVISVYIPSSEIHPKVFVDSNRATL
jgi:hypothetical protein